MNIVGDKVEVKKSASQIFNLASTPEAFEKFMPDNKVKFEKTDNGFVFGLSGMPEIALKISEATPNSKVVLSSAKESLDFDLILNIEEKSTTESYVQFVFEGKFNPFISMMVEKPLKNFIKTLTEKVAQI